jgi:hypothetical protein
VALAPLIHDLLINYEKNPCLFRGRHGVPLPGNGGRYAKHL